MVVQVQNRTKLCMLIKVLLKYQYSFSKILTRKLFELLIILSTLEAEKRNIAVKYHITITASCHMITLLAIEMC